MICGLLLLDTNDIVHPGHIPAVVQTFLDQFQDVFQTPTSLPPSRVFDHAITLFP